MTIYSIAITTRTGNVLASIQNHKLKNYQSIVQQFGRLEKDPQLTYVQSEKIKYVYQSVDDIYVVLITSLNSNIIDDISLLTNIVQVLTQELDGLSESKVCSNTFTTISVIQEFCNFDGTCEKVSGVEIEQNLAMQSQEEELYLMELEQKRKDAQKLAEQKAAELLAEKKLKEKLEKEKNKDKAKKEIEEKYAEIQRLQEEQMIRMQEEEEQRRKMEMQKKKEMSMQRPKKGGITLGKQKQMTFRNSEDEEEVLNRNEDENNSLNENNDNNETYQEEKVETQIKEKKPKKKEVVKEKKLMTESMLIKVVENVACTMYSENSTSTLNLTGSLSVSVADQQYSHTAIQLEQFELPLKTQLHPQMDAQQFNKNRILIPKQTAKGYAIGATPSLCVKWSYTSNDNEIFPLNVTCWPSEEDDRLAMTISYECRKDVKGVKIIVPINENVVVENCEGEYEIEKQGLVWIIGDVENGASGALEFAVEDENVTSDDVFPVKIDYLIEQTYSGIQVKELPLESVEMAVLCTTDFKVFP